MQHYLRLIANNAEWAREMVAQDPDFFTKREQAQKPHALIIGCSDSRVPLELMTGALPGEVFVHRNIGNQVWSTDMNVQSVLQFAVDVLDVEHVIVCGHSNCGALKAAQAESAHGLLDHWLSDIRSTINYHRTELDSAKDATDRLHKLSHLNVLQQVGILSRTPTVLDAWKRGKRPMLHGWVYDIGSGLIERLVEQVDSTEKAASLPRH